MHEEPKMDLMTCLFKWCGQNAMWNH